MNRVRGGVVALLALLLAGGAGAESGTTAIPTAAPASTPASLPAVPAPPPLPATFEGFLELAKVIDAAETARRVVRAEPTAPTPGTFVALETKRVEVSVGPTPSEVILRVPAELFVPEYETRLEPGDEGSPIGPLLTAGVPEGIEPPDFASSMTYALRDTAPAVEVSLRFPTRDDAARFRLDARDGALRAQLLLRLEKPWSSSVLDPYTTRTTIDEHGVAKTHRGKGPRRDEVVGVACTVVGHRIYFIGPKKKGAIVVSSPKSSRPLATRLVPPSELAAAAARAEAAERAEAKLGAALGGPDVGADLATCRAARDRMDFRTALESCTRVVEADPFDSEAEAILDSIPRTVPKEALRKAAATVSHRVKRCGALGTGPVKVELLVSPEGRVVAAGVLPPHTGKPIGRCVAEVARTMTLPPFAASRSIRITHLFAE